MKALEVASVRPGDENFSVKVPALLIARLPNVATPPTALTFAVPESVPSPLAMEAVTSPVNPEKGLPFWSRTWTLGWVASAAAALPPTGCWVTLSRVALSASILNWPPNDRIRAPPVGVVAAPRKNPVPPWVALRPVNVATPFVAFTDAALLVTFGPVIGMMRVPSRSQVETAPL